MTEICAWRWCAVRCVDSMKLVMWTSPRSFRCPQHYCAECGGSGDGAMMLTCNRCPVSYHLSCAPSGSIVRLNRKAILCPVHKEDGPTTAELLGNVSAHRRKNDGTVVAPPVSPHKRAQGGSRGGGGGGGGGGDADDSDEPLFCVCRQPAIHDDELWVSCDSCGEWYHPACVGLDPDDVLSMPSYICATCTYVDSALACGVCVRACLLACVCVRARLLACVCACVLAYVWV